MKTYALKQNLKQDYTLYTEEAFLVWKMLFERQIPILRELASEEYLSGIKITGFTAEKIPDFKEVNAVLEKETGWSLYVVEGIINEEDFFVLLSQKKFPATTWLRKLNELDYLSEPDMFHDVFGHVPLLTNQKFCDFFKAIGDLGVKHKQNQEILKMLGRIYWFTVEFGLIKQNDALKIYGAGILSSHGETKFSVSSEPQHLAFDAEEIMNTHFENDKIQDKYFVIASFDELYNSIEIIKRIVEKETKSSINLLNP
ncbi:MAG TPA: phenylalanine 4-monooxygenase [Bacteroidia bacterium]|jgi:phenylalanine-4-hydroxylase|nr:phenylalanine 4-monooxygenase [Bacteroidia bacterium]